MFEYKMRSKQTLWNWAWPRDQVGLGTGPDFLAKHKSGSIDFVESLSENMGIYMEFRKVWPFKCQNSENGTFIILFFFKKKEGVYTWRR